MMFCVGDKESSRIVEVLDRLERDYGDSFSKIFKSITFDNGSEFASSEEMERNGRTEIYYAHPYSSFERGTNENWNGIVRRFIPKGSSFEQLTERDMVRISGYINTLPRKRHRYKTPQELWEAELDAIMVTETGRGKVSEQPVPLLRMWGVKEKRYGLCFALFLAQEKWGNLFQNANALLAGKSCTVGAGADDRFTVFGNTDNIFNILIRFFAGRVSGNSGPFHRIDCMV